MMRRGCSLVRSCLVVLSYGPRKWGSAVLPGGRRTDSEGKSEGRRRRPKQGEKEGRDRKDDVGNEEDPEQENRTHRLASASFALVSSISAYRTLCVRIFSCIGGCWARICGSSVNGYTNCCEDGLSGWSGRKTRKMCVLTYADILSGNG
jgi:hypothetical protein